MLFVWGVHESRAWFVSFEYESVLSDAATTLRTPYASARVRVRWPAACTRIRRAHTQCTPQALSQPIFREQLVLTKAHCIYKLNKTKKLFAREKSKRANGPRSIGDRPPGKEPPPPSPIAPSPYKEDEGGAGQIITTGGGGGGGATGGGGSPFSAASCARKPGFGSAMGRTRRTLSSASATVRARLVCSR